VNTKNEALAGIETQVHPKLLKAIGELLNAGWGTGKIASTLSAQGSFGKHIGCHPEAIQIIANDICRDMNAENRKLEQKIDRQIANEFNEIAKLVLRKQDLGKHLSV